MEKVMNDKKLARYRGRFGEPKQTISRTYDCTEVLEELEEEEQKNEGARGFFRRLFGRDKQEQVADTNQTLIKSRKEIRKERREMRREERRRRRNRD